MAQKEKKERGWGDSLFGLVLVLAQKKKRKKKGRSAKGDPTHGTVRALARTLAGENTLPDYRFSREAVENWATRAL